MKRMKRFVGYIKFENGEIEEIDVDASDIDEAYELIEQELEETYGGDGEIEKVEEKVGLYF